MKKFPGFLLLGAIFYIVRAEQDCPLTARQWQGQARIQGAFLIAPLNLNFVYSLCEEFIIQVKEATQAIRVMNNFNTNNTKDTQFKRKISFLTWKLEKTYTQTITYIDSLLLCPADSMSLLYSQFASFRRLLDQSWSKLTNKKEGVISLALQATRPPPKPAHFPGFFVGLGLGLVGGGFIGSLFGSKDSASIDKLNKNIHTVNRKIQVTNKRLDILSQNVSFAIHDIKLILERIQTRANEDEMKRSIEWNLSQLIDASLETNLLFKMGETQITLLRGGILNVELIEIKALKKIINEGLGIFPGLEFPMEISKHTLPKIIKLITIQNLENNDFIAIIPLVHKTPYNIYTLVPLPIKFQSSIMLANTREVILSNGEEYIVTDKVRVRHVDSNTYMLDKIHPIWSRQRTTCEWEGLQKNASEVLRLCNFKKLGTLDDGIYLTETRDRRLLHLARRTWVKLNCPDGKIRAFLQGLHSVAPECDIETEEVSWPAEQTQHVKVENLIKTNQQTYEVNKLPIFNLNDTDKVHESIKSLIDKLPDSTNPLTISFEQYDWTLEEVQSYSIYAQSVITLIVIINSIALIIIIVFSKKNGICSTTREPSEEGNYGFRDSLRSKFRKRFPGSQRESFRKKYEKGKSKLKTTRDSLRRWRSGTNKKEVREMGTNTKIKGVNIVTQQTHVQNDLSSPVETKILNAPRPRPSAPALAKY